MQRELEAVRAEMHHLHEVALEASGTTIGEYADKVSAIAEKSIKEVQRELSVLVERRFGEIMGRLDFLAGGSSRPKDFKFANEPGGDDTAPDLSKRQGMN